jgi:dTDP-4-dehydrorhamnose reductase
MSETVLITGGSGLLALNWALAIRNRSQVILGIHSREIQLENVKIEKIGLESTDQIIKTLNILKPKVVIHTAGITSVELCENNPTLAQYVNVDIAENVAKACWALGILLVFISTDHLFSGERSFADENSVVSAINRYGQTKAEAEDRVLEANPKSLVIRTNFYGWGPGYRQSFSDIIIKSIRQGKPVTLFDDVYYTPILAETLVNVVHDLINKNVSGIFNIASDDRISKYDFGCKIARHFGLDIAYIKKGYLTKQKELVRRPLDMSLSNKKVTELLGKKIGDVDQHIGRLFEQEKLGLTHEVQKL